MLILIFFKKKMLHYLSIDYRGNGWKWITWDCPENQGQCPNAIILFGMTKIPLHFQLL